MKIRWVLLVCVCFIACLFGGYVWWSSHGSTDLPGYEDDQKDVGPSNVVKLEVDDLQQLRIKDHLITNELIANKYRGSLVLHADSELDDPLVPLMQLLDQENFYQDDSQHSYKVSVDAAGEMSIEGGYDEYSEYPIYITKQKVMSLSDMVQIQGGGFLAPNIIAEGIEVSIIEDDLWLEITDREDNELILYNAIDQEVTRDGKSYEATLWPYEYRYMTFIPAHTIQGWQFTYGDYELASRPVDFFDNYTVADELYSILDYTAPSQLLFPGTNIDLHVRINQDTLGDLALLTEAGDTVDTFSFEPSVDSFYQATIRLPDESGIYTLQVTDDHGYSYTWPIEQSESIGLDVAESPEDLLISLVSNFPLLVDELVQELDASFGEGRYELRSIDDTRYEIEYHLEPYEELQVSFLVEDIYGNQERVESEIVMGAMPDRFQYVKVKGDSFNLLPSRGYRANKIAIAHFNQPVFTLYYEPCSPAGIDPARSDYHLETAMLRCGGNKINEKYIYTELSDYRETYNREIAVPFALSREKYFRVSTQPNMEGAYYFSKSNLGIYSKTDSDELWVWISELDSGRLVENGSLMIYDALSNQQLASYALNGPQPITVPLENIDAELVRLDAVTAEDSSSVLVNPTSSAWWMYSRPNEGIYESYMLQSYLNGYDLYAESPMYWWGGESQTKIYGYTDRALYQPGDTVYFAGFVRDLLADSPAGYIPSGQVKVTLTDINGQEVGMSTIDQLDEFGGFGGEFVIRDAASLGYYYMLYEFNGEQLYSHDLRVEEYQKPTYFIDDSLRLDRGIYYLTLSPEYYFGGKVEDYDLKVTYTIDGDDSCWYCRWWNEDPFYYNHLFDNSLNTGASILIQGWTGGAFALPVLDTNSLTQQGGRAQLKVDIKIIDNSSDEAQFVTIYRDLDPQVRLGLNGQPSDWIGNDDVDDYTITIDLAEGDALVDNLVYEWYYQPFEREEQYGVDANWYYIQGRQYELVDDGTLSKRADSIPTDTLDDAGRYLLTVSAQDAAGNVRGQVQKQVLLYRRDGGTSWQGSIGNNYKLAVYVPKKEYTLGESVPISIDPYVVGATVVVTVEKGYDLLYQRTIVLTGSDITIPVQETWYPNVNISVMEIVGEQLHPSESQRQEPRFYAGYAQVELSQDMIDLNIDLQTDKTTYEPGDTMILTITTTDSLGNPIDARLSVGVVDKALHDLYALIKQPIPYFYNKLGSFVGTFTNLKMLYQMLQVFSADGEKGGGGGDGGFQSLGTLRDEFLDTAFWQSEVITRDGKAELRIDLPDNLTTWMIDAIGITKDNKLGTVTSEVKVTKPFLIEPNLPTFVTLGDSLSLPVKVVVTDELEKAIGSATPIKLAGSISYPGGEDILLESVTITPNEQAQVTISVPYEAYDAEYITLSLAAVYGEYTDGLVQNIPLRKDGFILHDYLFSTQQQGKKVFSIAKQQRFADIHFSAALLPVQAFDQAFDYLLHYPYGCTEQLMSSLYPIATALLLNEGGYLDEKYLDEQGEVELQAYYYDDAISQSTTQAIYNGLNQMFEHQQSDGGFAYWESGESVYPLSAYVYGGLMLYRSLGYDIPTDIVDDLVRYLNNNHDDPRSYLYYQWQRAQYASQDIRSADIVEYIDDSDQYSLVLAYATLIALGDQEEAERYNQWIDIESLDGTKATYGVYMDDMIMQSIYLRALLDGGDLSKAQRLLTQILKQRDGSGRWGWSTQRNVQGLLTVSDYLTVIGSDQQSFSCEVSMGNRAKTLESTDGEPVDWLLNLTSDPQVTVNWSCDAPLFIDAELSYLYADLQEIGDERIGVNTFAREVPRQGSVGDKVTLQGKFDLKQTAHQLAVEFYLPSTFKFLETISKKGVTNAQRGYDYGSPLPFEISGKSICYPDHREVRFDRLFLYYDELPAKTNCEVAIDALYAYEGEVEVMPARLREMYDTQVYARDVITN